MKAAVCYEFEKPLVIEEIEIGEPQAGEVKIKLAACAICSSDIHYLDGAWGGALPAVYGHEASGLVVETGPGVTLTRPGDHVVVTLIRSCGHCYYCSQGQPHLCETEFRLDRESILHTQSGQPIYQAMRTGAFAEYVVVEESQVVPISKDISLDSASLLACGVITGVGAVTNSAQVPTGSSVVVIGTGGVGLNTVQGARIAGANPIIAIDLLENKLQAAREFGATYTINLSNEDPAEHVRTLTEGRGADYVFVTVGSGKAIESGLALLRKAGTLVIVGMPASGVKIAIEAVNFASLSQIMMGSKMGSTRLQVDIPRLIALYQDGRLILDELITARYPLEEINTAVAEVKAGNALRNVIIFD